VRTLHDEVETERQVALDEAGAQRERAMWRIDRGDAESAEGLSAADTLAGTGRFRRNPLHPTQERPLRDVLWIFRYVVCR
jgi:hypothetical protein